MLSIFCFANAAGFSDNDDDDDDDGSQSMISTAASSRVSTAKSRASSARVSNLSRWSGAVGSSKPCSSASSKKTNAWASTGDDKQEKVPPLVPSLFVHVPATVYFFTEGEKGIFVMYSKFYLLILIYIIMYCTVHVSQKLKGLLIQPNLY